MGDRTECVFVCVSVLYESESKWVLDSWEVKGAKCIQVYQNGCKTNFNCIHMWYTHAALILTLTITTE